RMIADCLAGDRRLAVVMLRPGWERDYEGRPPVHAVAGMGEILQADALSDGRFNILLDGRMRIRLEAEEPPGDRPYRVGRAPPLRDVDDGNADPAFAERLLALRGGYSKLLVALGQGHPDLVGRLTVAGARPGSVIDRIVSAVVPDAAFRQRVLETADVRQRLDLAAAALADLLTFVSGAQGEDEGEEGWTA